MSDNTNTADYIDLEGTLYPREEAARLTQSSLRQSRFLVLTSLPYVNGGITVLRNYGVDFPDTVPVHLSDTTEYTVTEKLCILDELCADLRHLLPRGGVICVPPPDHLLCEVCRIGVKIEGLFSRGGKEVCESCKIGTDYAPTEIATRTSTKKESV